jgi:hypothetical protein
MDYAQENPVMRKIKTSERILLSFCSLAWVFLFAAIGKRVIEPGPFGESVGVFCGISMSFITIFACKSLIEKR